MGIFQFFFGQDYHSRAQRDQWNPTVIGKNIISPINDYGTCFSCEGSGHKTLQCKVCKGCGPHSGVCRCCQGSGHLYWSAKPCLRCSGTGTKFGKVCPKCNGTGEFRPATTVPCKKCGGSGQYSAACRKCGGIGHFTVTCRKCSGSGWHKF